MSLTLQIANWIGAVFTFHTLIKVVFSFSCVLFCTRIYDIVESVFTYLHYRDSPSF